MANLIQATVYQIDGSPVPSPLTIDFRTREVVIREASVPTIPSVQSAILFYNVPNNPLSVQTFYVSESIATLVGDANNAGTSQTQVTVLTINEDPQVPGGVQYSFPSNEILVGEATDTSIGVQAFVQFKNVKYYTLESEAAILAASNNTGVAAGTNPTSLFIPYNNGGIFGDSYLVNDTDILKTVWNTVDKGLKLDFLNEQYTLGRDSTEYLRVQTELIYTNYGGNDIGLKLDFASNTFTFGDDVINNNFLRFTIGANSNAELSTSFASIGDVFSLVNGTTFNVEDNNQIIKSTYGGADVGLKLDFANNQYVLGDYNNVGNGVYFLADNDNGLAIIHSNNGVNNFYGDGPYTYIGDTNDTLNGSRLGVNDLDQHVYVSANLVVGTSGGASGQYLKIRVGGVDYKIALLNNA